MRLTIAYSKIKKRNLVLIDNGTHQRGTVSERPIRQPLSFNNDKSEVMIISTRHKLSSIDYNNINVNVNGVRLQNVNKCKHLSVIIDDKLTWRDQVDKVRKKVLVGTYTLWPNKNASSLFGIMFQKPIHKNEKLFYNNN